VMAALGERGFRNASTFRSADYDLTHETDVERMLDDLRPTLKRDLRPGARIVTHGYDFGPSWPPEATQDISGLNIHLWTIR